MIGVRQTITSKEEGGNCFAACLASILELPLAVVPNPALEWRKPDGDAAERGWALVEEWLAAHGMYLVQFPADDGIGDWRPAGYWIGSFPSPRLIGETHAVVMHGQELAWDPHPASDEQPVDLSDPRYVDVFYVLDPVRIARVLSKARVVS